MKEEKQEKVRIRKNYAKDGVRSQTQMTFRIDNDNVEWLKKQTNKGRYINELIVRDRKQHE